ncbi:hypothetical protein SME10J_47250 [Serratia marcescens]|nr:hypothetical protein SME10J_47250 [Serratia marcescens]
MGLDINFFRQRKADYPMLPVNGDWTPVGDWVPCSPAWLEDGMHWVDNSVGEVTSGELMAFDRNDVQMLDLCLSRLNEANCHDEFPSESRDYGGIYWTQVDLLREYVNSVLAGFGFSLDHLYFRASW